MGGVGGEGMGGGDLRPPSPVICKKELAGFTKFWE